MMSQPDKAPAQVPEYQYDALPDGQSIRILTLYPGALDDPLEDNLEFFNITSTKSYESLVRVGQAGPLPRDHLQRPTH